MTAADPTGVEIPTGRTYMKQAQISDAQDRVADMEKTLSDPAARIESRGEMRKMISKIRSDLEFGTPPDTTPEQRTALAREEAELLAKIKPDMLSQEELRKCPPGAIGAELKFQKNHKSNILRWKNIRRVLRKGDDDPDVANLELHRGKVNRLNMDNAVIAGTQHFLSPDTPQYRANYDATFGVKDDAQDEQIAELQAQLQRLEKLVGKQTTKTAAKPSGENAKPFTAVATCGKKVSASAQFRADNGRKSHERNCTECKGAAETA